MGTTVTSNLALIKPDDAESIKANLPTFTGWAVQNGANCDVIDGLFRNSIHTYVPVWTADVGNPVIGAGGIIEGKYIRVQPRMVFVYFRIVMGAAGFSAGSGLYSLTLPPVAVAAEFATFNDTTAIGKASLFDASTIATCNAFITMFAVAGGKMFFRKNDGDAWRSTTPITLATGDILSGYGMYPTGDA